MSRPFGVSLLIAGVDDNGPQLWNTDPSGAFLKFKAIVFSPFLFFQAIGNGADGAQSILKEKYDPDMSINEAKILALSTIKQVMEEKLTNENVELALVPTDTKKFTLCSKEEITALIEQLP